MSCSDFQSTSSNCVFFLGGDTHLVIQFPLNYLESRCPVVEGIRSCTCQCTCNPACKNDREKSLRHGSTHMKRTTTTSQWHNTQYKLSQCDKCLSAAKSSTSKMKKHLQAKQVAADWGEWCLAIQLWNGNSKDIVQRKLSLQGKLMRVLLIMWWRTCRQYQQSMQSGRVNTFIGKCAVV